MAEPCDHTFYDGLIEFYLRESRDGWVWDQCPQCGEQRNFRHVPPQR